MTLHTIAAALLRAVCIFSVSSAILMTPGSSGKAGEPSPFTPLIGRWVGEGKLGVKDSPHEVVKCRVTYLAAEDANHLKQNIRCATAGGSIEVLSAIAHNNGQLAGTWSETTHNINGNLTGQVTPRGFRVVVKGEELAANMDIILRDQKQIVEIQFFNSALYGLTLTLTKG